MEAFFDPAEADIADFSRNERSDYQKSRQFKLTEINGYKSRLTGAPYHTVGDKVGELLTATRKYQHRILQDFSPLLGTGTKIAFPNLEDF